MKKKLNFELQVRCLQTQCVLTASLTNNGNDITGNEGETYETDVPTRLGGKNALNDIRFRN